ncbi:MAG: threonine/serine exporter family protein [Oscillospiraceae bacterium]|nr:threonine/serine exporter family protein [Oscillospiraceae bacterium]
MEKLILPVFYAFAASLCFGVLFNIRGKKLWAAAACGALSWAVYLLSGRVLDSELARYFLATVAVSVCAEILARIFRAPVITYLVLGLIPLVPGAGMYDTMERMIGGDMAGAAAVGLNTLGIAASLGLGIVLVSSFSRVASSLLRRKPVDKQEKV